MGASFCHPARGFVILAGLLLAVIAARERRCYAQDSDAVSTDQDRRPFSVADQIADPAERRAFVALYGTRSARERLKLSDEFLAHYPQSWFLPQVNEVAAKAAIELGDYDRALTYGRESLRLLPENPLLLVLLANVEVLRGMSAESEESARNTLDYLDRFGRPGTIPRGKRPKGERRPPGDSFDIRAGRKGARSAAFD
jgi:tetratricopeptide (TPR) repeat protein